MQVCFIQLLKLNAQAYNKVQNNRGYAPGLAWVRYNQGSFHLGGMIIKSPSFPLLRSSPRSIVVPIMIYVDATQRRN